MNYKLAKQLKDAGFPQKLMAGDSYYSLVGHPRLGIPHQEAVCRIFIDMPDTASLLDDLVKIPTLEELIEWCGDKFLRLDSPSSIQEAFDIYEVRKAADHWNAVGRIDKRKEIYITGKTPAEAVAKLGLKLL